MVSGLNTALVFLLLLVLPVNVVNKMAEEFTTRRHGVFSVACFEFVRLCPLRWLSLASQADWTSLSLTLIHFTLLFLPIRRFDIHYHLDLGRNDFSHFSFLVDVTSHHSFHGATARNGELQRFFLSCVFPYFLVIISGVFRRLIQNFLAIEWIWELRFSPLKSCPVVFSRPPLCLLSR
jgi:hypothetical protein